MIVELLGKNDGDSGISNTCVSVDREAVKQLLMEKNTDEVLTYLKCLGYLKFSDIPDNEIDAIKAAVNNFSDRKEPEYEQK